MKNLFYIKINKERISTNLFEYPCESISDFHLDKRNICIIGGHNQWKNQLKEEISFKHPECNLTNNPENCTDIIILPSNFEASNNTPQLYFDELFYYQDVALLSIHTNTNNLKNIILILPSDSDIYSTNYKRMADYATLCFSKGLSNQYANKGIHVYTLLINESLNICAFMETILYCLSKNSNHIVGKTFKLE